MLSAQNYPTKIGVACIIKKSNQVLVGKRCNSLGEGCWAFPGGHLEPGETPFNCALRETFEETGLRVVEPKVLTWTFGTFEEKKSHYVTLFVETDYAGGEASAMEPDKCEAWIWCNKDSLPFPLFDTIKALAHLGYRESFKNGIGSLNA